MKINEEGKTIIANFNEEKQEITIKKAVKSLNSHHQVKN